MSSVMHDVTSGMTSKKCCFQSITKSDHHTNKLFDCFTKLAIFDNQPLVPVNNNTCEQMHDTEVNKSKMLTLTTGVKVPS